MLGRLVRRAVEVAVALLALYAFAFVPLGAKTGLEHTRAVFGTAPARAAADEAWSAAGRLYERLVGGGGSEPPAQVIVVPVDDGPDASIE